MNNIPSEKYNFSRLIKGLAFKIIQIHPVDAEWRVAIITLAIARFVTMIITAYAAYTFFFRIVHKVIQNENISAAITLIILILVELLAAIFLDKTYKFFFHGKYFIAAFAFIIVIGFYSLSFISSSTGLALRESTRMDFSIELQKEYISARDKANHEILVNLSEIDSMIKVIRENPATLINKKRILLSIEQQRNMLGLEKQKFSIREAYVVQLDKIEKQFQVKKRINQASMIETGREYYKFMEIIVIAQFLMTGILIYLLHSVFSQYQKEQKIVEELNDMKEIIKRRTHSFIYNGVMEAVDNLGVFLGETPEKNEFSAHRKAHKTEFKSEHNNDSVYPDSQKKFNVTAINKNINSSNKAQNNNKHRAYLYKHKKIVNSILQNVQKNQEFLSNADIKNKIVPSIKKANFKSFSLIRKVFSMMLEFGFENFDSNGISIKNIEI